MENQQDEMMNMNMNIDGGAINNGVKMSSGTSNNNSNNYLCRQSSTRWTPTTEQIKLLKELYYTNGVRSPSADQIQTICARLRRYGKIEGKNVFYWFQNHKARERQKKRLTPNATTSSNTVTTPQFNVTNNNSNFIRNGGLNWIPDHQDFTLHAKYPCTVNNNPGVSCSSSSAGVISGGGQLTESFNYGAVPMEYKFRDCSISGGVLNGGNQLNQWSTAVGTNYNPYAPASYSNFIIDHHKISTMEEYPYIDQNQESQEIETLPLFPMHNEEHDHDLSFYNIKSESDGGYYNDRNRWPSNGNSGHTSLELSLNSYGYGSVLDNYSRHSNFYQVNAPQEAIEAGKDFSGVLYDVQMGVLYDVQISPKLYSFVFEDKIAMILN